LVDIHLIWFKWGALQSGPGLEGIDSAALKLGQTG
jgi:hypothetical protein